MRCCGAILLLAVAATQGALGSLRAVHIAPVHLAPAGNSSNADVCLSGFEGATAKEQCASLLHYLQAGGSGPLNLGTPVLVQNASSKKGAMPEECSPTCEEKEVSERDKSIGSALERDGQFREVNCCTTVRRRLAYYQHTKQRCEKPQSTCWASLQEYLPRYIEHYKKLDAECDKTCKGYE
eukprot:gnl/TRDRNA2_/TRDRNA2_183857_c0_seq1.p1 gnl/TRDRNA2_/TRDRNA2_183857_c0~~gnl/TRDRNA2_/TRDRNA2_183857_c0_seq1.p1  ORF type:complete len:181 (-),score=39.92 gnl/TRDRNA2_/TRDRNA2_183857_c0_seq1:146-688(-)